MIIIYTFTQIILLLVIIGATIFLLNITTTKTKNKTQYWLKIIIQLTTMTVILFCTFLIRQNYVVMMQYQQMRLSFSIRILNETLTTLKELNITPP